MKIVSWNVNSIKARAEHVKKWLAVCQPDVLMLQELKGLEFSGSEFRALGYESVAESQKAYNGVAMLAKHPITVLNNILSGDPADTQARFLEVEIQGTRLINIYAPNGNPVFDPDKPDPGLRRDDETYGEKFDYKLSWMKRLYAHLKTLREKNIPFAIGGDFNVIPEGRDCYNPKAWEEDALFRIESRQAFRKLLNLGLIDAFRIFNQSNGQYTFWDYQAGAWPQNKGIRIDHFLLSPELADRVKSCTIDAEPRGWDKPSDHTPIMIEIE